MRAFSVKGEGLQLGLADLPPTLRPTVEELGFERRGAVCVRRFPAEAAHRETAAARFEECAELMVRQAAGLDDVPWENALSTLLERTGGAGWWLTGSAALAVRGLAVAPRDLDVITSRDDCRRVADALVDLLVEPFADGGHLGAWWWRAFAGGRIECVGGVHASIDRDGPSDFGPAAGTRLERAYWNGWTIQVPPLELQLRSAERRGLADRAALIREALA